MFGRWGLLSEDDRVGLEENCQSLQWKVCGGDESKRNSKREAEKGREFDFVQLNRKTFEVLQVH